MSQSNLEKQEARIEQNLGKQIIRSANLDYGTLTTPQIKMIAKKVAAFLNQSQNNQ